MGKQILLVDDSAAVRQQVGMALGQAGFEVIEASDGNERVQFAKEISAEKITSIGGCIDGIVKHALSLSDDISKSGEALDKLSGEAKLLALNDTIEAAHLGGDQGNAFGVISEE